MQVDWGKGGGGKNWVPHKPNSYEYNKCLFILEITPRTQLKDAHKRTRVDKVV